MINFLEKRLPIIILFNVGLVVLGLWLAFVVRFDFVLPADQVRVFWRLVPAVVLMKMVCFWRYRLFSGWWRYVSMADLIAITKANVLASSGVIVYAAFVYRLELIPRSVLILDAIFCFLLVAGTRFIIRACRELYYPMRLKQRTDKKVLIVGAGDAGQMIARELRRNEKLNLSAVGFVDDDARKLREKFHGVLVLGSCNDIPKLCRRRQVDEVIIAMPSATGSKVKEITALCHQAKVACKTLPSVGSLIDGSVSVQQLKEVALEDLLGREAIRLDVQQISDCLHGKRVLITGAGGSIGSELCRQVARFKPAKLVLFENAETPLFLIDNELKELFPLVDVYPIIGDVRHRARVEAIFDEFMPQVVFHAAAYKHVPMMEVNPAEAVNNNVRGTQVVAETADAFGVQRFVMVSTDKAVNPTNVMGTTKRIAEKIVQTLARRSKTRFVTVRFGNVLGSNGSVIPTFTAQIKEGGPVTVTHPEITRFFMTIPEASQLVMQAGSMGLGGEIYLLDMGEPVKIVHLAEELIRLSGKEPYEDIAIEFTGLRPGEKLFEELLLAGEGVRTTKHEKICIAAAVHEDEKQLQEQVEQLYLLAKKMDLTGVLQQLKLLVPEYQPSETQQLLCKRVEHSE
ncbi:MAG: nucleoside-diphosphate sugar epimerase/dehydratase [Desulfuromonas sp.]|nr:nucleoside-diphosphate sugar epimerase/dehydratase [Desulfuromonas sp.]